MKLSDLRTIVFANTRWQVPPLCPELRLRLFASDSALAASWGDRLFHHDGPRPYWAFCWASGQVLARYVLDHPKVVSGLRIADVGAGSGVAAIAAAMAGATEILAVDRDPLARVAIRMNAIANGVRVSVADLNPDGVAAWCPSLVLAGDICYEDSGIELLSTLNEAGIAMLVADPGRPGLRRLDLDPISCLPARTFPELETAELTSATLYRFRVAL